MKTSKKNNLHGKHCINLYADLESESAGIFITGHYEAHKALLIAAATENPNFAHVLLDAALEFAKIFNSTDNPT